MTRKFTKDPQTTGTPGSPGESASEEVAKIRKKLRHFTLEKQPGAWLKTGVAELDAVFGAPGRGIPYGRVVEVSGKESGGKTTLVMDLAAIAQKNGAKIAWADAERTWDAEWATKRGLNTDAVAVFKPEAVLDKDSTPRLMYAEELFKEVELWIQLQLEKDVKGLLFVAVDSVPAIMPQVEVEEGLDLKAMAVRARFLTKLLTRWVAIADSYNVLVVLINQIRTNPGVAFGNPEYTPGGQALKFYSSVRVGIRRARKGGHITKNGVPIGIKGIMTNLKNKTGGVEGMRVGYKLYWEKPTRFVPPEEIEAEQESK